MEETSLQLTPEAMDDSVATKISIPNSVQSVKRKQLEIINETNPAPNTFQTWIRKVDDIRTWDEVLALDDEREGQFVWGDFPRADAEQALKDGTITVYSSYPIKNGVFVSTSLVQAQEYAGGKNGKVYSKTIPLSDVAWINGDEGQYAKITTNQTPSDSGDVRYQERPLAKKKKTAYNVYNTNALQWAKSASRNADDLNVLYDPRRGEYFLIGVSQDSDMGFIELNSGTRLQMERERDFYYEQHDLLDASEEGLDAMAKNIEDRQRDNNRDNVLFGQRNASERDGNVSFDGVSQGKQTPDGTGDSARTEADSGGIRKQDRANYQSARDVLLSYAEDARNTKVKVHPLTIGTKKQPPKRVAASFYIIEIMRFPS